MPFSEVLLGFRSHTSFALRWHRTDHQNPNTLNMALNPVIAYVIFPSCTKRDKLPVKSAMEKADETCDFQSSKLGTRQYWEGAYQRELKTFGDIGDIGEIWFGEDSQERVVDWLDDNEDVSKEDTILDLGCGNGALLLELRQRGFTHLTGVDYVQQAIDLAQSVLAKEGVTDVKLQTGDLTADASSLHAGSCLRCQYQVCLDKGTFDAISLTPDGAAEARQAYKRNVKRLLQPSGIFLITSCNWTKEELMEFFQTDFKLVNEIPTPSFQFGGRVGRSVTSLIFSPL